MARDGEKRWITQELDREQQQIRLTSFERLAHAASVPEKSRSDEEMLKGALDMMILRTLQSGDAHGHTIAKIIERTSEDVLQVEQGSLYHSHHQCSRYSASSRPWVATSPRPTTVPPRMERPSLAGTSGSAVSAAMSRFWAKRFSSMPGRTPSSALCLRGLPIRTAPCSCGRPHPTRTLPRKCRCWTITNSGLSAG